MIYSIDELMSMIMKSMGKTVILISFTSLVLLLQSHYAFGSNATTVSDQGIAGSNYTTPSLPGNTTSTNSTIVQERSGGSKTGAVVIGCLIALVTVVAIVVAVLYMKKRREMQTINNEKKMQIQMSSARNAGVYQDLTVSAPESKPQPASPEQERLKNTEEC